MSTAKDSKPFRKTAQLYKALANERRLLLLSFLSQKEHSELFSVADIAEELHIYYQQVSRHLQILDRADLVERVRHGYSIGYRLTKLGQQCTKLRIKT